MPSNRIPIATIHLAMLLIFSFVATARAIPIEDAVHKTGSIDVTLTQRSPLSGVADINKRINPHSKPDAADANDATDYDLSKEPFRMYVPTSPADDGSYGLISAVVFADGHGFAPHAFEAVLEQHHLIWIGPMAQGDDHPQLPRIGTALDATFNVNRLWKIDPRREYVFIAAKGLASGTALYYPDVYNGAIDALQPAWFAKLTDSLRRTWDTDSITRPAPQQLGMAKSHTRFFLAYREKGADENFGALMVIQHGYLQTFKFAKMAKVPHDNIFIWSNYTSDWFEQGIQYLDAGMTGATTKVATQPATETNAAPASQPQAVKPGDDPAIRALNLAKSYVAAKRYDLARPRLQKIIDTYPNTPAAVQAKNILDQIPPP